MKAAQLTAIVNVCAGGLTIETNCYINTGL